MTPTVEVIAMHGWASDARCWNAWRAATDERGWHWECGERGYGEFAPHEPRWKGSGPATGRRLVIGHSLGPHLVPPGIWPGADGVVLLASFARFIPTGREGRRGRAALSGMARRLDRETSARVMLADFLAKAAAPQPVELMPAGPAEGPLREVNRVRLREDLDRLERCAGLPDGFPGEVRVLIVEAGEDHIVEPEMRAALRAALPGADVITLSGVGHALLAGDVIGRVVEWVEAWRKSQM
jgi:pimeloyl-[acyl-carrier protein] methyl ester esterase